MKSTILAALIGLSIVATGALTKGGAAIAVIGAGVVSARIIAIVRRRNDAAAERATRTGRQRERANIFEYSAKSVLRAGSVVREDARGHGAPLRKTKSRAKNSILSSEHLHVSTAPRTGYTEPRK